MAADKWDFSLFDESDMLAFFEYLDDLVRGDAAVNRFYIPEFLKDRFGLSFEKASDIFAAWSRTYDTNIAVTRRASVVWKTYGGG